MLPLRMMDRYDVAYKEKYTIEIEKLAIYK